MATAESVVAALEALRDQDAGTFSVSPAPPAVDAAGLAVYVRECADLMRLRDWDIDVTTDPEDEPEEGVDGDRCATFQGTFGRRHALIWVSPSYWVDAAPEQRRQTICHELIHAHHHGAREVMANALARYPSSTAAVLKAIFDVQAEYAIDSLANVLAPLLPLPPEGI